MSNARRHWFGELPSHWQSARVVQVARLESGHTPSRQHPEWWVPAQCTVPWFSLADVWQIRTANRSYITETAEKISPLGLANSAARVLPKGTVMLSRTASVGFAAISAVPMATTQDFANWVCGPSLLPEYLLYCLRGMKSEFDQLTLGSTHMTIYMPSIRRLTIPLPPLTDQRRIADFLDARCAAIDAAIEKKERMVEAARARRDSLLDSRLTEFATRYPRLPLRRQLRWIEQGWSPQCESRAADPHEWGVLKVGCVNGGIFDPGENKALPKELAPMTEYRVHEGDLLVSRANTRELVGSAALVSALQQRLLLCDKLFRLHVAVDQIDTHYLALVLRSPFVRSHIESNATGASDSMKNIGQDTIRSIPVSVPPIETQRRFAAEFRESERRHHSLTAALTRSIAALREYRTALITAAVTGQLPLDAPSPAEAAL
jgi:type I restriction enzyme S subunit